MQWLKKFCIGVIVPPQPSQVYVCAIIFFLKMSKVKVKVSLTIHEDPEGRWNVGLLSFL
jgi:hypothetical protein